MEIKIGKSARACKGCDVAFIHEQALTSAARYAGDDFERDDYCESCWTDDFRDSAYSVWNSRFYDPEVAKQAAPESFSPLRQTFYEAIEGKGRDHLAMAYLGAQLLRRQKVFRLIKEAKDPDTEESLILFNDRIGNRLIEVQDPSLSHAELEEGRKLLMKRLAELEAPEETEESEEDRDHGESESQYAQV